MLSGGVSTEMVPNQGRRRCWDPEHLPFWKDAELFLIEAGLMQTTRGGS